MRLFGSALAVALIATPTVGFAADMPWGRSPTVVSERSALEEEIGSGWYLRGDIGYTQAQSPTIDIGSNSYSGIRDRGSFSYGGGFGYKFNEWLRADATIDQISSYGLKSRIGSLTCFTTHTCDVSRGLDGRLIPVLANAYVDLGNWGGFTPYVGAGVGAARVNTSGTLTYSDQTVPGYFQTNVSSKVRWTPAFAAMAGVAVDIGSGIQLDAGYRYLWIAEDAAGTMAQSGTGGAVPWSVALRNSGFHQARIGLRYYVN